MERNELKRRANRLWREVEGINRWIMNNPDTDPNLYQMVDCLMEYWYIRSFYLYYLFEKPTKKHPDSPVQIPFFDYLSYEMCKMLKLRGIIPLDKEDNYKEFPVEELEDGSRIVKSEFFEQNPEIVQFLIDLQYLAIIGAYPGSKLTEANFDTKKHVYAKIAGVTLYIWQKVKENPEFTYSNKCEYMLLEQGWDYLMELYEKKSIAYEFESREIIEHMLDYIKKHADFDVKELYKISRR